tara:strand:+ start:186 stop:758 length:573 start_codon:yes stop_codon:yes gene_type:complete
MESLFKKNLNEHLDVIERLNMLDAKVSEAIDLITSSLKDKKKLMICGNGGSAADAQHLAAEFTGRFIKDRIPLAALALTTDSSALTCISNDYSYKEVFSRQLLALAKAGDCLLAISTSGNSENVLAAVEEANRIGVKTIGLLGRDGGNLIKVCNMSIVVPSEVTARIQEAHILIGHTICGGVEINMGVVK